jgi:hypothetical protein
LLVVQACKGKKSNLFHINDFIDATYLFLKGKASLIGRKKSIDMTTQEVVEVVKESHLWESLLQKEKRETIMYVLQMCNVPINE